MCNAFETSHQFFDLLPTDVVSKIRKAEVTYRKKQALFTAPLQRTGTRGFAGEQGLTGLQYYAKAHKDYGFGAIRAAKSMEFKSNWETGLYGQTGNQLRRDFPNQVKIAVKPDKAIAVFTIVFAATAPATPSNIIIRPAKYIAASPKLELSL